ncbi:MAG: hypothetical protein M3119_08170, partial [Verrucomicrobiota bacterium]|nr:hypothetical protein [Verrucomicrobiota bacterium]
MRTNAPFRVPTSNRTPLIWLFEHDQEREHEKFYFAMQTFFASVKKRSASSPPSRPTPLCFM